MIHCKKSKSTLTKLKKEETWKKIVEAAKIRSYKPVLELAATHETNLPSDVSYHRECQQMFTLKSTLESIKKNSNIQKEKEQQKKGSLQSLLNSCQDFETSAPSAPQLRSSFNLPSSTSSASNTLLPELCIICNKKDKYVKRELEPLRTCQMPSTVPTLKKFATEKSDFQMLSLITTRNLYTAFGKYHHSCYQDYTRPVAVQKPPDSYKTIELEAFHLVIEKCNDMIYQHTILRMQELTTFMTEYLKVRGIAISNSTKKNLRRNIEKTFGEKITFLNTSNKLFLYPSNITNEQIFKELYKAQEDDQVIINAANLIRKEITDMKDEIPWPPQPEDLEPDAFQIPSQLERFLLYLFGSKSPGDASNQSSRYQHSIAQDLIYTVTAGRVKTPKSLLLQCVIKSLTNNVEIITILNRLGHGVSYSTLSEMLTENAYKIADQQAFADVILPETLAKVLFAIYVADNIDRNEETLSGIHIIIKSSYSESSVNFDVFCLKFKIVDLILLIFRIWNNSQSQ